MAESSFTGKITLEGGLSITNQKIEYGTISFTLENQDTQDYEITEVIIEDCGADRNTPFTIQKKDSKIISIKCSSIKEGTQNKNIIIVYTKQKSSQKIVASEAVSVGEN